MKIIYQIWLILFLFYQTESTHYPIESCYTNDCSYQFQNAPEGSCVIYNTSVCLESFFQQNHSYISDLTSEANSLFAVSVIPYQAEIKFYHHILVSPMNITFHIQQEGVNRIAVKITTVDLPNPICRVFDFKNYAVNHTFPITLFYECLYFENHIRNIFMEFVSLSTYEKLSYYVYIPSAKPLKSACDWHPIIMVFYGSLSQKRILVKFSQAPQWMNISTYIIKFIPYTSTEKVVTVPANQENDMLYVEYLPAEDDNYSVSVFPVVKGKDNCTSANTIVFYVGTSKDVFDKMIMMYVCIVLFVLGSAAFLKLYWSYSSKSEPRLLLVHFMDDIFENVIQACINYLTNQYGCKVSTIYKDSICPLEGLEEMLTYSDYIMIVISEKLYFSWDSKNFQKIEADHHFCDQPVIIGNLIYRKWLFDPDPKFKKIKIATVCFSSTDLKYVPDWVKLLTKKCYMLPDEMRAFLYFIFEFPCVRCFRLQCWWFSNNVEHCKEGKILSEAVQTFLERDLSIIESSNQIKDSNTIGVQACYATDETITESTRLLKASVNPNSLITNCSNINAVETDGDVRISASYIELEMSDDHTTAYKESDNHSSSLIESFSKIELPRENAMLDPTANTFMCGGEELYISQARQARQMLEMMPESNMYVDDEKDCSSLLDELLNAT